LSSKIQSKQDYNRIDQQIHQLSQIIAKANRTFVPKAADDSHTNLYFDSISQRIYGRWIKTEKGNLILALNLQSCTFEWINDSLKVIQKHAIQNQTSSEIEQSTADALPEIGLGFGLAMEDNMVGNPYFYLSGNGRNGQVMNYYNLPKLTLGNWAITDHWKGAVLPLPDLEQDSLKGIQVFLKEAVRWYMSELP